MNEPWRFRKLEGLSLGTGAKGETEHKLIDCSKKSNKDFLYQDNGEIFPIICRAGAQRPGGGLGRLMVTFKINKDGS